MNWFTPSNARRTPRLTVWETVIFALLGALMYCSKIVMEALPNIHLLGMLTMTYTVVFRRKALIPIYVYVMLNGLFAGFSLWWVPYLYIWTVLWGVTMLLPQTMPKTIGYVVYPAICCLHGLCYGILYAPAQALIFHLDFRQTVAWVIAGFPFDLLHGAGNLLAGLLILPFSALLKKLMKTTGREI